jgi:DNA-binding transcriptional ArsR family regulator
VSKAAEKQGVKKPGAKRSPGLPPRSYGGAVDADAPEGHFAKVFAALGEPTRLKIMQILPREPRCDQMYNVVELAEELGLRQPTVSHHLKILSDAGLVAARRDCNSVYYYVNQPAVLEWMGQTKRRFGCDGGG